MEDVLQLYEQPHDADRPVVCMDESPKQLIEEVRTPIPAQPGQPARYDSEYKRNGTCCVFGFCEPKRGWRELVVTEQRTMKDFAWGIKWLLDVVYPAASCVRLVLDNLNTHRAASLYETFEPKEARRLLDRGCQDFCVRGARRLVHGGGRRLRRTTDAVGKSGVAFYTTAFMKRSGY